MGLKVGGRRLGTHRSHFGKRAQSVPSCPVLNAGMKISRAPPSSTAGGSRSHEFIGSGSHLPSELFHDLIDRNNDELVKIARKYNEMPSHNQAELSTL
jgi:hypothetical protein